MLRAKQLHRLGVHVSFTPGTVDTRPDPRIFASFWEPLLAPMLRRPKPSSAGLLASFTHMTESRPLLVDHRFRTNAATRPAPPRPRQSEVVFLWRQLASAIHPAFAPALAFHQAPAKADFQCSPSDPQLPRIANPFDLVREHGGSVFGAHDEARSPYIAAMRKAISGEILMRRRSTAASAKRRKVRKAQPESGSPSRPTTRSMFVEHHMIVVKGNRSSANPKTWAEQ